MAKKRLVKLRLARRISCHSTCFLGNEAETRFKEVFADVQAPHVLCPYVVFWQRNELQNGWKVKTDIVRFMMLEKELRLSFDSSN